MNQQFIKRTDLKKRLYGAEFHELMVNYRHISEFVEKEPEKCFFEVIQYLLQPYEPMLLTEKEKDRLAIQWCRLNRKKGGNHYEEMERIEARIGKRLCLKKWRELLTDSSLNERHGGGK